MFLSSVVISTPLSNSCKFSSCCSFPFACICPKAVAIPSKSAPVAPAISAILFVLSTSLSVSNPNAFNLFVVSINSDALKGVTAPKAFSSAIIVFVFATLPVKTSKDFLCLSNSAV
jgi:hypothetical protein